MSRDEKERARELLMRLDALLGKPIVNGHIAEAAFQLILEALRGASGGGVERTEAALHSAMVKASTNVELLDAPTPPDDKMLLPCPFCGGEASDEGVTRYSRPVDVWWQDGTPVLEAFFVNCMSCFANTKGMAGGQQSRAEAIAAWNTRTPDHPAENAKSTGEVDGWQPIETAPYQTVVRVRAGDMTFLATLEPNASVTSEEVSCDQWQAAVEGEHPPCWSGGACWGSNEDEMCSLQPTGWQPVEIAAALARSGKGEG